MIQIKVKHDCSEEVLNVSDFSFVEIGRLESCHICLESENISRKHLLIHCDRDSVWIKDISSHHNWVFYLNEKIIKGEKYLYIDGNEIILPGGFSIRIEFISNSVKKRRKSRGKKNIVGKKKNIIFSDLKAFKENALKILMVLPIAFLIFILMVEERVPLKENDLEVSMSQKNIYNGIIVNKVKSRTDTNLKEVSYDAMLPDRLKCRGQIISKFCKKLFYNRGVYEGVIITQKDFVLFMNIARRQNYYEQVFGVVSKRIFLEIFAFYVLFSPPHFLLWNSKFINDKEIKAIKIIFFDYDRVRNELITIKKFNFNILAILKVGFSFDNIVDQFRKNNDIKPIQAILQELSFD